MTLDFSKLEALARNASHPGDDDLTAKQTEYKGIVFTSQLEAKWAVFFDECGAKWEYRPGACTLLNGKTYVPDFSLYDVYTSTGKRIRKLLVDVRGRFKPDMPDEKEKIWAAAFHIRAERARENMLEPLRKIIVLGNIPCGRNVIELEQDAQRTNRVCGGDACDADHPVAMFNSNTVTGKYFSMMPMVNNRGRLVLASGNDAGVVDEEQTMEAYRKARVPSFDGKYIDERRMKAIELEETYNPTRREKLAIATKERLPGWLIMDALGVFVPTDFLGTQPQERISVGCRAVGLLKDALQSLREGEEYPTLAAILKSDNISRASWAPVHQKIDFFEFFKYKGSNITVSDYYRCLEMFEQLIFGGFESRPKRQAFWDRWLEKQMKREEWITETSDNDLEEIIREKYAEAIERYGDASTPTQQMLQSMHFVSFDAGMLTVEFSKKAILHMKTLEWRKKDLEEAFSNAFSMPVTLHMRLKRD